MRPPYLFPNFLKNRAALAISRLLNTCHLIYLIYFVAITSLKEAGRQPSISKFIFGNALS